MRKLKNEELDRLSTEEFRKALKRPVILILDDLRSMHNVGAAFRTADAFRIEHIYLCGITATPPHREIQKAALGATETVSWTHETDVAELVRRLQMEGVRICVVEQADESTSLSDIEFLPDTTCAFVFGNEVFGVKDEVVQAADHVLEIPQLGSKHSLNVSVSIGVVLWEHFRQVGTVNE